MRSTPLPTDETALVQLAASCNDRAFCALMDRFRGGMRQILSRYADNREDREDLEAEVIARFLRDEKSALRVWEPRAPFAAYVWTITTRHAVQWAQRRNRLGGMMLPALPWAQDDGLDFLERMPDDRPEGDPVTAIMAGEAQTAVADGLARLTAEDRLILLLRFEQGMNGPGIARTLGIPHGAARKRLFTALRRLVREVSEAAPWMFEYAGAAESGNTSAEV